MNLDFLLGGGVSYDVTDGYDSAWEVELGEQAKVCARVKDAAGTPLIWETDYGKGKFVVDNFGCMKSNARAFCSFLQSAHRCRGLSGDQWLGFYSG